MKISILLACFMVLTGCTDKMEAQLHHCFQVSASDNTQDCSVVAEFKKLDDCKKYKMLFSSLINYNELEATGKTTIIMTPTKSDIFCKEK